MKYKFVELKTLNVSLWLANAYHNDKDTCVYLLNLINVNNSGQNGVNEYHYKVYRLYNNELEGPQVIITDKDLILLTETAHKKYAAYMIDSYIEESKSVDNGLEYADSLVDSCTDKTMDDTENPVITVPFDWSGLICMMENNGRPELSSPTNKQRDCHSALTYLYVSMRNRKHDTNPLAIQESDEKKVKRPRVGLDMANMIFND